MKSAGIIRVWRKRWQTVFGTAACCAALCLYCAAQEPLWSEEFSTGTVPDSDTWSYDLGSGSSGWGNLELQEYTDSLENVRIENGLLIITARRQGNDFTSGRIRTENKFTFLYGTLEARIRMPDLGDGLWPAFWTLGNSFSVLGWPACGEIDVVEMGSASAVSDGVVNRRVGSAAHWKYDASHAAYGTSITRPVDLDSDFHLYRLEWTPDAITTYIDDVRIWTMTIPEPGYDLEEFHQPHFILLNLAVGGIYTGILDAGNITAPFPAEYAVDYIRLYDNGYTVLGGSSVIRPGINLLENPGFESDAAGWTLNLSGGTASGSDAYAHSGSRSLVLDSTGAGGWSVPNLAQSFPANAGDVFNLQGYVLQAAATPVAGGSFGLCKIEFRDSFGTPLDPVAVDTGTAAAYPWYGAEARPFLTASSETDQWIFSETQAEAPADTAWVSFILLNVNDPAHPGAMYFDDIRATRLGDPVLSASHVGDDFVLRFPTRNGISYQVVRTDALTNQTWIPVETVAGDGQTNTVVYPANQPAAFFRIHIP